MPQKKSKCQLKMCPIIAIKKVCPLTNKLKSLIWLHYEIKLYLLILCKVRIEQEAFRRYNGKTNTGKPIISHFSTLQNKVRDLEE